MASGKNQPYVEEVTDSETDQRTQAPNVAAKRTSHSSDLRNKGRDGRPDRRPTSSASPSPPPSASSSSSSASRHAQASSSKASSSSCEPIGDSGYCSHNSATEDSADSEQSTKSEKTALAPKPDANGAAQGKKSKRAMKVDVKQEQPERSRRQSPTKTARDEHVQERRPKDRDLSARKEKTDRAEDRARSGRPERREKERDVERDRGKEREKDRNRDRDPDRDPERERERKERKREQREQREREREREQKELQREQKREKARERERDRAEKERGRERADRLDRQRERTGSRAASRAASRAGSVRPEMRIDYPAQPQGYAPPSPSSQRHVHYPQPPIQGQPQPQPRPRAPSVTRPRPESWYGQQLDPFALGMPPFAQHGPPPSKSAYLNMQMQQSFPYGGVTPPNPSFMQPNVHASPVSPYDPIRPPLSTRKTDGDAVSARRPRSIYGSNTIISYPDGGITDRQSQLGSKHAMADAPVSDIGPSARYTSGSIATNPLLLAEEPFNHDDEEDDEDYDEDFSDDDEDDAPYHDDPTNYMMSSPVLGEGEYDRRAMPPPPRPSLRPHQPRSHTANEALDLHRSGALVPLDAQSRSSRSGSNSNPNISRRGSISRKPTNYAVPSNTGATRIITVENSARPQRRMSYAAREQRVREAERLAREYRDYPGRQERHQGRESVQRDADSYPVHDRDPRRPRAQTSSTPSEVDYRTRSKLTTADAYQRAANQQANSPIPLTAENVRRGGVNGHIPSVGAPSDSGSAHTSSSNSRGRAPRYSPMNMMSTNTSAFGGLTGLEGIEMEIRPDGVTLLRGHENRTVQLKHGDGHARLTLGEVQDELAAYTSRLALDDTRSRYTTSRR